MQRFGQAYDTNREKKILGSVLDANAPTRSINAPGIGQQVSTGDVPTSAKARAFVPVDQTKFPAIAEVRILTTQKAHHGGQ